MINWNTFNMKRVYILKNPIDFFFFFFSDTLQETDNHCRKALVRLQLLK
jgi:hypothetical protein